MRYSKDPYVMTAKFNSKCSNSTCGKDLVRGKEIVYYPLSRKATCLECGKPDIYACQCEDLGM